MPTIHGSRSVFIGAVGVPLVVKSGGTHLVHVVQIVKFFRSWSVVHGHSPYI